MLVRLFATTEFDLISQCPHCNARYQLPDKMLGKQARCKSCKRSFMIVPAEEEVELPDPTPPGMAPGTAPGTGSQAMGEADELEALANAASGAGDAPVSPRGVYDERDDLHGPRRMAKGATASMALGITSCIFVLAGVVLMIVAMVNGEDEGLLALLGVIALGVLGIGAVAAMLAVVNGTGANKHIRKARHPLGGQSRASAGSITGSIALGIVFICAILIGVYLARRGGITFQNQAPADNASTWLVQPTKG